MRKLILGEHSKTVGDIIVADGGGSAKVVAIRHHQAARQYAEAALEDAHVDVQNKAGYTLTVKHGLGEGDHGWVVGLEQELHDAELCGLSPRCRDLMDGEVK